MYQQVIARRYAKGLLLSAPDDRLESIEVELKALVAIFLGENKDLYRLLEDPSFSPLEKKAVINRIAKMSGMSAVLHNFLLLLVEKDRVMLLPFINDSLTAFIDEKKKRVRAKIKSASKLDDQEIYQIKDALKKICKKEVLVSSHVLESLLGGIRVEMGGLIYDGTVRAKLDAMRSRLCSENYLN